MLRFVHPILVATLLLATSGLATAQLPSQGRTSPLNYFGRFHGLGYSDGYHACPSDNCGKRTWFSGEGFSSYYGLPSSPTPNAAYRALPSYSTYQSMQQAHGVHAVPGTVPYASQVSPSVNAAPSPGQSILVPSPSDSAPRSTPSSPSKPRQEEIPSPKADPQTYNSPPFNSQQQRVTIGPFRQQDYW